MSSVRVHLWFGNNQAVQAAEFYAQHIPGSSVTKVMTAPEGVPGAAEGSDFIVEFTVAGVPVTGLNAGPEFNLDEAFSFYLSVDTQEEVDRYWELLTDGGAELQCGWLKDKYGLAWQVVPEGMEELLDDADPQRAQRAMQAMLGMVKIDLAAIRQAADGVPVS